MIEERIQLLDDLGVEFARVAAEHGRKSKRLTNPRRPGRRAGRRLRVVAISLSALALLAGSAFAVPATRTGIQDVTSAFVGWIAGDNEQTPGRELRPDDDVPPWFRQGGQTRLIAKADGVGLYVRRVETGRGTQLEFGLGEGVGVIMGGSLDSWRERFDQHAAVVLGPALFGRANVLDHRGRFPLLGVTARSVQRVELRYAEGPPLVATSGNGGFVLIADAWRPLRELVVYDASGRELERIDVSDLDMRYLCDKEPSCPSHTS